MIIKATADSYDLILDSIVKPAGDTYDLIVGIIGRMIYYHSASAKQ